jgi:hypothetical protein
MKNFSTQFRECKKLGILKEIRNKYNTTPEKILLCTKFLEICSSEVCRHLRECLKEEQSVFDIDIIKKQQL